MAKNDLRDKGVDREGCVDSGHRSKEVQRFIFLMLLVIKKPIKNYEKL